MSIISRNTPLARKGGPGFNEFTISYEISFCYYGRQENARLGLSEIYNNRCYEQTAELPI